ncbi:hypothetical protein FKP32DRAFT_1680441, partial [Trametes sanguinea]
MSRYCRHHAPSRSSTATSSLSRATTSTTTGARRASNKSLAIVTFDDLGSSVTEHAQRQRSQLVLVPWLPPLYSGDTGSQRSTDASSPRDNHGPSGSPNLSSPRITQLQNPFEALFRSSAPENANTSEFVQNLFASAKTDVALFVDRHMSEGDQLPAASTYRLLVPFFGGPDDRLALEFAVQLCANPRMSAMVVRMTKHNLQLRKVETTVKSEICADEQPAEATIHHVTLFPDTVYAAPTTQTRLQSETADSIAWARYTRPDASADPSLATALSRMVFTEAATATPLQYIIDTARTMAERRAETARRSALMSAFRPQYEEGDVKGKAHIHLNVEWFSPSMAGVDSAGLRSPAERPRALPGPGQRPAGQ